MESAILIDMLFTVVGGLSIFLLGMNNMSAGMQAVAGNKMRQLVGAVTNNRFMALTVGFLVTAIIQSSSVTTVMVVGFVNAQLLTLTQAIGVILGANIGTTITGWILVLKIGKYGLPLLGFAGLYFLFCKNERNRYIARMVMGIGMIFFGLELMKNGFKPLRSEPEFLALIQSISPETIGGLILCVATGAVITAIIQSSSASVGIVMGMASTGVITFSASVALVLGMNIGTTITAFLASLGTNTNAKRTAYAHTFINILGALIVLPFFSIYMKIILAIAGIDPSISVLKDGAETFPQIIKGIAIAHTVFNIFAVVIFIPFISIMSKVLLKIVPDKPFKEQPRLTKLDIRMLETPMMVIEQSRNEILHMGQTIKDILNDLRSIMSDNEDTEKNKNNIFREEENLDNIQKEITTFLMDTISGEVPHNLVQEAHSQLRMADEYESMSDYVTNILKLQLKLQDNNLSLSSEDKKDILSLHDNIYSYFNMVYTAILERHPEIITEAHSDSNAIVHLFREIRARHLQNISDKNRDPLISVTYMNMLNSYRRIKDHNENVAEALAGEK
jgi:phosphate:Na+ symporter